MIEGYAARRFAALFPTAVFRKGTPTPVRCEIKVPEIASQMAAIGIVTGNIYRYR